PRRLRGLRIDADPEHGGSGFFELGEIRFIAAHLIRADRCECERVKREHHILLAAKIRELHRPAFMSSKFKIRRFLTSRQHLYPFRPFSLPSLPFSLLPFPFCLYLKVSIAVIRAIRHVLSALVITSAYSR